MSPGTLPVLREEEEDVGQEEVEGEPGGENETVSDHISVEIYDDEEETQHIDEEKMDSGEEETQHTDEEEIGSGHEDTQHIDEEEMGSGEEDTQPIDEEEAEMMDSGEEEDTGTKNLGSPGGWSVVVHYDEESWDGALQDTEKIVTTGQPFAEQESEKREVRNAEQGAYENSGARCFVGVTEDVTMEITAGNCEEEERQTAEENQEESSDSDPEVLTSSITKKQRKEGNKVANLLSQQTVPQENEEEEEQDEDGAPEVVYDCPDPAATQNVHALMINTFVEHPLQKKMKEFQWDDHQEADERFADYPSVCSPCKYKKDGGKLSSPLEGIWNTEENVDVTEEVTAAISPREEGEQDCAMFNTNIDTSTRKSIGYHLEPQSDSNGSSGSSSEDEEEQQKYNEEHPAQPRYQGLPRRDRGSEDPPLQVQWGGGEEDSSKQSVAADLHLSETISDVPTFTFHSEARRCRAAITISRGTGNMSSSDSEESFPGALWTSEAEQREDKRETWLWGEAGPGALEEERLCKVQLELAGRLKSHIHTDISWDTGENNVERGGLIQDYQYDASGITESGELADEEDDEEDDRSWEQEKERIKAFYKFYNDDEEEGENAKGTECDFSVRKPRVQFCMDPLPQVIEYTDSSDVDLVDNLSDGDEDLDSTERLEEQSEPERQTMTLPETPEPQGELQDLSKMPPTHTKRDRCLKVLKLLVKITLLTVIGLLTFWWTRYQLDLDW
ncbi:midasin-like isoform X2 [Salvelinus fontinalis]|uniref:midasin-like isoform X2 n=1 Tax=Salvelinus fontinalis TaxID=8038 RepID=UPI002486C828|nr:midasin-like isoform X2 [Salvelinus fontinalis]